MLNMWPCIGKLGAENSKYVRIKQPMNDCFNNQGRRNPRGGLCYFWTLNKTWTLPIDASGALKIIKKYYNWESYIPQSRGGHPKNSFCVVLLLLEFKDYL